MESKAQTMKAIRILGKQKYELIEEAIPVPNADEILIKVKACGIGGVDVHLVHGGSYFETYPIIPGREFSGEIAAIGSQITRHKVGDRVAVEPNVYCHKCEFCLNGNIRFCNNNYCIGVKVQGGLAEYVCVPENAAFNIGNLSFEDATMMEPLSCVLHGLDVINHKYRLGQKVLLVGTGPIGWLFIQCFKNQGYTEISVIDKIKNRLEFSKQQGADRIYERFVDIPKNEFDLVVDATGVPSVISQLVQFSKKGGTILLFGITPKGSKIELDSFDIFQKGLTIQASFTNQRNSLTALELLKTKKIDVTGFISHRKQLSLEDFKRSIEIVEKGDVEEVRKIVILPELEAQKQENAE